MRDLVKDLREWITALEAHGLLRKYEGKIDVRNCSNAILENFRKATLFENIDDYGMSVIANAFSSRQMMALALETNERNILSEYQTRILKPVPPSFSRSDKTR